jgi:RNA polymerase sigma-70 factor (ECF subfamily)
MGMSEDGSTRNARLTSLFQTHSDRVYRLARRLSPTADDALDLMQETFVRAAQRLERVPTGAAAERAWLCRVLVNVRKDEWRRQAVRQRAIVPASTESPDPHSAYVERATVWRALDALAPRRRAVVTLFELDGLSVRDIAVLLGISPVTVRWHLSRGRKELVAWLRHAKGAADERTDRPPENSRPAESRSIT